MDADCLIKLTKAGLKELIAEHTYISIPEVVRQEVVDAGKRKGCADALAVERNVRSANIDVTGSSSLYANGDHALIELFDKATFDAVATDDKKLTRILRAQGIRFILPALILYQLHKAGRIDSATALWALDQLADFISEDEFSVTRLLLEKEK